MFAPPTLVRKKQPSSATSQDPAPTPSTSVFAIMKDCYARDSRLHTAHRCQTEIQEALVEGTSLKHLAVTVEENGSISSDSCFNPDRFQSTVCRILHTS